MYKRILVPVDGSDTATRGLQEAIGLAADLKAKLILLHVIDDFPLLVEMASAINVEATLDELRRRGEELAGAGPGQGAGARRAGRDAAARSRRRPRRRSDRARGAAGRLRADRMGSRLPRLQPPADRQRGRIGAAQQPGARCCCACDRRRSERRLSAQRISSTGTAQRASTPVATEPSTTLLSAERP